MVKFDVGDKILVEFSTFGDRFLGVVTEVVDSSSFLLFASVPDVVLERMKTDKHALVRYADEGVLRGFNTRVLNRIDNSSNVFELEFPDEVFDAEERHEPRCACRFPATVVEGERAAQAVVEDMSVNCSRVRFLNGGLISFIEDIEREVRLTFHPFDVNGDGYSVNCVIKNAFVKEGERYAVLEFKPEEKEARGRIARFVETQVCCGIPRL